MNSQLHRLVLCFARPLILIGCFAVAVFADATVAVSATAEMCSRWPQNRLFIGRDLQSRRFLLEPKSKVQLVDRHQFRQFRAVFHRTFSLTFDAANQLSLFYGTGPKTCFIDADQDREAPLLLPVFFIGREGESLEELKENAERLAFAPSALLDKDQDFTTVAFRLSKGGSRFSDIRPFFRCGLPGLLVCESRCPDDHVELTSSLVNAVLLGKFVPEAPAAVADNQRREPSSSQPPAAAPKPINPAPPAEPKIGQAAPPEAKTPQAPPAEPKAVQQPPVEPKTVEAPPSEEKNENPPPEPKPMETKPAPQPVETSPPPPPAVPAQQPIRHILLVLQRKSGAAVEPAEVLAAEGRLSIEGTTLSAESGGLAADLTEDGVQKASDLDYLKRLFRRYQILSVNSETDRIILTVDPLYIRADDLTIRVIDATGEPVRNCDLALDVSANRRLGPGWGKVGPKERVRGLPFFETGGIYRLDLPANVDEHELLIATSEPGNAARLSNVAAGCELEARPLVAVEELRSGSIARSLQATGPILIAILTTDSEFAPAVGREAVKGFWNGAVDIVNGAASASWTRVVVARAQAPGPHKDTGPFPNLKGGFGVEDADRSSVISRLIEGSQTPAGARLILRVEPLERFHLDIALELIRRDAGIPSGSSVREERLLMISGSVNSAPSYSCLHPVRRDKSNWVRPQWARQTRKAFFIEIWDDVALEAIRKLSRLKTASTAPSGVYQCDIPGTDSDKIALFGLGVGILRDEASRAAAFGYLKEQAAAYLRP